MQHNPYTAPVGPPQGMMGGQLSTGQYEFSQFEEQQIKQTGSRARIWGFISIALGLLLCLFALVVLLAGAAVATQVGEAGAVLVAVAIAMGPMGLVYLAIGWFYISSGGRLAAVAETQGNDVEHLMHGLDKLANAFRIEAILSAVAMVLGFVLGFVAAVM